MSSIEKAVQKNGTLQPQAAPSGQEDSVRFVGEINLSTIEKALEKRAHQHKVEEGVAPEQKQTQAAKNFAADVQAKQAVDSKIKETVNKRAPKPVNKKAKSAAAKNRNTTIINLASMQKEGFVSETGRQVINEEFRAIKRKVLSNAFGPLAKTLNNSNIVMVTSPNPGEGKTFSAINLALSIALEQDKTVLLVDADVLRPNVMRTIDQPFDNGLMEYLLDEVDDLSEVIYHTNLDTLRIIPAGKSHHLSAELLASEKMLETVNEFANRYPDRVVIFDTPPLVGINETAILANLAGQAVIVVQEGKTNLTRLSQAVEQLNPDMAKGFLLNKATPSSSKGAGYYGYYYYGSDREEE